MVCPEKITCDESEGIFPCDKGLNLIYREGKKRKIVRLNKRGGIKDIVSLVFGLDEDILKQHNIKIEEQKL